MNHVSVQILTLVMLNIFIYFIPPTFYPINLQRADFLFDLMLNISVSNFSVISG